MTNNRASCADLDMLQKAKDMAMTVFTERCFFAIPLATSLLHSHVDSFKIFAMLLVHGLVLSIFCTSGHDHDRRKESQK